MIIFWGRKTIRRKKGYVADFCPLCRTPNSFLLERVGSAGHIYGISFGEGKLVGFERTCQECGIAFAADPNTYVSFLKKPASLNELVIQTFPNLRVVLRERLALEEKIRQSPKTLAREERDALIRSPFLLLSAKVEKRFSAVHIDKGVGLSMIAALALVLVGLEGLKPIAPPDSQAELITIFFATGLSIVVWQIVMSGKRFMRRQIVPLLAKSLRPLQPSEPELAAALSELKKSKYKIGKKLKLEDLAEQLPF